MSRLLPWSAPMGYAGFRGTRSMEGAVFKTRLRALNRTQVGFGTEIGVSERTVHTWAANGPPDEILYLLDLLTQFEQPLGPPGVGQEEFRRAVEAELERLWTAALDCQHGPEFLDVVGQWMTKRRATD
jgi:hypothetical protein